MPCRNAAPVDGDALHGEILDVLDDASVCYTIETAIDEPYISNRAPRIPHQVQCVAALATLDIAHIDASHLRIVRARIPFFVQIIDANDGIGDLPDLHIPHVDVLDESSAN